MTHKDDLYYYTREINYLRKEGARFAEKHPNEAFHLGFAGEDKGGGDPHAERIVESFAFLTGKLNRYLEAQFPELVHSLFQMLYPYYLRPTPAKALVLLAPVQGMLDNSREIPKETTLYAKGIGPSSSDLTFTTCWTTWVHPMDISRFYIDPDQLSPHSLSLELRVHKSANPLDLQWDLVDFLISGDTMTRHQLFLYFHERLEGVRLKGRPNARLEIEWIGFDRHHDYNDEDDGRFAHIHFLKDYFDYPERYYYFRIKGLKAAIAAIKDPSQIQLDFILDHLPSTYRPEPEHIRLHTCVARNLFKMPLEGFRVEGNQYEYELTPDSKRADLEVVRLLGVIASKDREKEEVRPYYRFQHQQIAAKRQWFYALRQEGDPLGKSGADARSSWRTFVRFIDGAHLGPGALDSWNISGEAMCSNGIEAQRLQVGQLNRIGAGLKDLIKPRNLELASRPIWPSLSGGSEWKFLAHLALDYSEFHDPTAFKTLLELYIPEDREAQRRKLEGIEPQKTVSDYIVRRGSSIPGERLVLTVDATAFKNAVGDIALFARVLGHFLQAYTSINSFLRLVVVEKASGATFEHTAWGNP